MRKDFAEGSDNYNPALFTAKCRLPSNLRNIENVGKESNKI